MTRESTIERKVSDHAQRTGWWQSKFTGRKGVPDRVFIRDGRVVFIEFKAPGKKPTPLQTRTINAMIAKGAEVHVVDSLESAARVLAR